MNLNTADVFAFSDSFTEFIRNSNAEFLDMGVNVGAWLSDIEKKKQYVEYLNREKEKIKAVQNDITFKVQDALTGLYDNSINKLNALIGAIGSKCELGRQAVKIKNKVRIQRRKKEANAA